MKARNFLASSTFFAPAGMWIVSVGASSPRGTSGVDFGNGMKPSVSLVMPPSLKTATAKLPMT
jgi:hypothetical protein